MGPSRYPSEVSRASAVEFTQSGGPSCTQRSLQAANALVRFPGYSNRLSYNRIRFRVAILKLFTNIKALDLKYVHLLPSSQSLNPGNLLTNNGYTKSLKQMHFNY